MCFFTTLGMYWSLSNDIFITFYRFYTLLWWENLFPFSLLFLTLGGFKVQGAERGILNCIGSLSFIQAPI